MTRPLMLLSKISVIIWVSIFGLIWNSLPTEAQQEEATYVVQIGDTLTHIALKYKLNLTQLAAYNNLSNPNLIIAGQQLKIPTNATASPVPIDPQTALTYIVQPGDTLFTIANRFGLTVEQVAAANTIVDVNLINVGQELRIANPFPTSASAPLPLPFEAITLSQSTIAQGRTLVVQVVLSEPTTVDIVFEDRSVFITGDGQTYWGIVGVHGLQEVGLYSLGFRATLADGRAVATAQDIVVIEGDYGTENITVVPGRENLLDTTVIRDEIERLRGIWLQVSATPLWQSPFSYPVEAVRHTSLFGTRRSYNGGPINSFHTGSDFGGPVGTPIYAPAAGLVVLAEFLDVRGGAVIIDHGLGLFSGYWHQSEIAVEVGEAVSAGQLIGYLGNTGLVTGPHLHWEMRLGGIAVDPIQWVSETIP